jgi:hypothetical protein
MFKPSPNDKKYTRGGKVLFNLYTLTFDFLLLYIFLNEFLKLDLSKNVDHQKYCPPNYTGTKDCFNITVTSQVIGLMSIPMAILVYHLNMRLKLTPMIVTAKFPIIILMVVPFCISLNTNIYDPVTQIAFAHLAVKLGTLSTRLILWKTRDSSSSSIIVPILALPKVLILMAFNFAQPAMLLVYFSPVILVLFPVIVLDLALSIFGVSTISFLSKYTSTAQYFLEIWPGDLMKALIPRQKWLLPYYALLSPALLYFHLIIQLGFNLWFIDCKASRKVSFWTQPPLWPSIIHAEEWYLKATPEDADKVRDEDGLVSSGVIINNHTKIGTGDIETSNGLNIVGGGAKQIVQLVGELSG